MSGTRYQGCWMLSIQGVRQGKRCSWDGGTPLPDYRLLMQSHLEEPSCHPSSPDSPMKFHFAPRNEKIAHLLLIKMQPPTVETLANF